LAGAASAGISGACAPASARYSSGKRQVIIYRGEDGFWVAECPGLPGCVSQGESREAAVENIREAIEGYVLSLKVDGLPVPEERFDALLVAV
jgi:predicted RNase H-like HicB family nuclease